MKPIGEMDVNWYLCSTLNPQGYKILSEHMMPEMTITWEWAKGPTNITYNGISIHFPAILYKIDDCLKWCLVYYNMQREAEDG